MANRPLIGKPGGKVSDGRDRQIGEQLGDMKLRIDGVAKAAAGSSG